MAQVLTIYNFTLTTFYKALQSTHSSVASPGGPASRRRAAGSTTHRRPDLVRGPLQPPAHTAVAPRSAPRAPARCHAAAARCRWTAIESIGSNKASDSLLPPTECSLRSGCVVDERHGTSTHTSTLRGRGRAIKHKLTWASLSVGKHSATAPAIVGART